jgi:deazaflavin-dependent oxidoreductase (nitroreductase family)
VTSEGPLPARRSAIWSSFFRLAYRFLRLIDPLIRSWIAIGGPGLDGVVDLRFAGRRTGRPRRTMVTLLTVDGQWYVGHPNGPTGWIRNVEAAGVVDIEPEGVGGSRYVVHRLMPGPERDAVIRATWTQQPFPADVIYRAARRHVTAVGVYHRLDPLPVTAADLDQAANEQHPEGAE